MSWGTDRDTVRPKRFKETVVPIPFVLMYCFLQYFAERLIERFDRPICLRVITSGVILLDFVLFNEPMHLGRPKRFGIVRSDAVWNPEAIYDVSLQEVDDIGTFHLAQWYCLCPLGEVVRCSKNEMMTSRRRRVDGANDVYAPSIERPCWDRWVKSNWW